MTTAVNGAESETLHSFADMALPESVKKALDDKGYESPTPVQFAAFAPACGGTDLVVQARTGTGKTAAFGLPLVGGRLKVEDKHVQALVLCPTRELALQVKRELEELAKYTDTKVVAVYGGAPMGKQITDLEQGPQVVVGTPGRVLDHMSRGTLDVSHLRSFVLDECDEMLSMGFLPQINDVWEQLPKGHQTLLFSATVPPEVSRIADTRLKDPEFITLSGDHIGALEIEHYFYLCHSDKADALLQVIELEQPDSAIIFCNTREACKRVAKRLQDEGHEADWLNADLAQNDRERVMRKIRESQLRFLVCTDVAARGIDISHLTHVMNFDFPDSAEQYVHRTGRTGRAGRTGTAISFVAPSSIGDLYYLRLRYKIQPIERQLPSAQELKGRQEADVLALLALKFPTLGQSDRFYSLARRLLTHDQAESVIAGLLKEHLGSTEQAEQRTQEARKAGKFRKPERSVEERSVEEPSKDSVKERRVKEPKADARESGPGSDKETPDNRRRRSRGEARSEESANGERRERRRGRSRDDGERRARFEEDGIGYVVEDAPKESHSNGGETKAEPEPASNSEFVSLYVNVGKRDGARLSDLQSALDEAGIGADETGRITIRQRHSFIEVRPTQQDEAIDKLSGRELCGREMQVEVARPRGE